MMVNLPFEGLFKFLDGKKTYGAVIAALVLQYGQQYIPWLTPEIVYNLGWGLLLAALAFTRSGSKTDAANAVEAIKTLLETPINAEPVIEDKK